MLPEEKTVKLLKQKGKTLSTAESCSGGLLSNRITNVPGSSDVFYLGITAYDNRAKTGLLRIPKRIILKYGAVSPQVAGLMAKNVRKFLKTDIGTGITGIAGPTGQRAGKPVGLVFIAVNAGKKSICRRFVFKGTRTAVKNQASTKALELILKVLSG